MDSEDRSTQKDTSSSAGALSLSDLIARLEKATGPDRETDLAIHLAVYPDSEIARLMQYRRGFDGKPGMAWDIHHNGSVCFEKHNDGGHCFYNGGYPLPRYTTSIDAAMTLRPDGANCSGFDDGPEFCEAYWSRNNVKSGHWLVTAEGKSPAIALCIAALKARSHIESLPANDSAETRLEV